MPGHPSGMVTHIVFWRFLDEANGQDREANLARVSSALQALPALIPEIETLEVGRDFNRSGAAFDLALYTRFASREHLATYQAHPEHQKVKDLVVAVVAETAVVDYES